MKYSNKRKDFFYNKKYLLYSGSEKFIETGKMFVNIAKEIGMPIESVLKEIFLFAKAKNNKNCLIVTILFGSPNRANRYVQTLNKNSIHI